MSNKLYYVAHAQDAFLKPLTSELFDLFTTSKDNQAKIQAFRRGADKDKSKNLVHLFYFQGVKHEEKYAAYLAECGAKKVKARGSRNEEFMLPTAWLMIDIDHEERAYDLWQEIRTRLEAQELLPHMIFAHITPSGKGLRLVMERLPEMMLMPFEDAKCAWLERIAPGKVSDSACSDYARGSFCPLKEEILYIDRDRFFSPPLLPEGAVKAVVEKRVALQVTQPALPSEGQRRTFPDHYEGTPYKQIIERLIPQLDGSVNEGGRHQLIMGLAVNLRYICDNNPEWLAQIIPTFGIEEAEFHRVLHDMCAQERYPYLPRKLRTAIEGTDAVVEPVWEMPRMPEVLPPALSLLVKNTPERMQAAVAMAAFPALGTHLHEVYFRYADNKCYEPAFLNLLIAPQASGKSAVDVPIDFIMSDITKVDECNRQAENEWREKVASMGSNKEKPSRPKHLCIQRLSPNTTNAAFVKRLKEAGGRTLYIKINELEQLQGLSGMSAQKGAENELIKITYDRTLYGQERVGIDSVSEQVILRLNWNASTTPVMAQKFFTLNALMDGTISRITCCTIPVDEDDWGEEIPVFGTYDADFEGQLQPSIQALCQARGTYTCTPAIEWARRTQRLLIQHAKEMNNKVLADYVKRGVRSGFNRAMLLYIIQGCQWTEEVEAFASWSVEYDLWVKWNVFHDKFVKATEMDFTLLQRRNADVYENLPTEFTKNMLQTLRQGVPSKTIDEQLRQWKRRSRITYDADRDVYIKSCKNIINHTA